MAYISRALLNVVNQYSDSTTPVQETMIVQGVGTFYNPFRNDYLSGHSAFLKKTVHVPVLPKVAASAAIGSPTQIMIGDGVLRKQWVASKERYDNTSEGSFRTVYIAIFVLVFAVCSVACLRWFGTLGKVRALQVYCAGIVAGAMFFYLF